MLENKFIKSEEIEDTTVQAMDLVSEETGRKRKAKIFRQLKMKLSLQGKTPKRNWEKDDKTEKDMISDTSKVIGTNEAEDVAPERQLRAVLRMLSVVMGKKWVAQGGLTSNSTEGPEAGGTGEVSVEEGVETNEAHKKSEDGKGEEQLISSSENRLETSEEVGTNEGLNY